MTKLQGLGIARRGQQVDRIPDAPLLDEAVKTCERRHGHAAREASFDSCGHWIGFERQQRPRKLRRDRQAFNRAPRGRDRSRALRYCQLLLLLVREDIPEPANAARNKENPAENADRNAGE